MAVEIKELVIRAVIDYQDEKNIPNSNSSSEVQDLDRASIVKSCVRQVLQIINRSNQR